MSYLDLMPEYIENPGVDRFSPAKQLGHLLAEEMKKDKHLYLFSPDETTSNKLDEVYQVSERAWSLSKEIWDLPESEKGRIVELLSENTLFALQTGHVLENKERAYMTSYESFFEIIASQILQYIKFLKQVDSAKWRAKKEENIFPAINLLSTSTCWRQDHNGFSHQSPALISTLLNVPGGKVNCIFPVDDVSATAAFDFMQASNNVVNLTTFNKTDEPRWIDRNHAKFQYDNGGASIFGFASNCTENETPDYVLTAAGDIVSREALYAIKIINEDIPGLKLRFVGINSLCNEYNDFGSCGSIGTTEKQLSKETFDRYYSTSAKIVANFHGYPETLKSILVNYTRDPKRVSVHGFEEHGSTTTPFEMLSLNHASRYDLAIDIARSENRDDLVEKYQQIIESNRKHAEEFGEDLVK